MNAANSQNALFQAALEVQSVFQELEWRFCFIGGLAVLRWGEPRMTQDIDLCLQCGFGAEVKYIEPLFSRFNSRIPNAERFAQENRVALVSASNGVAIDISLSGLPFEDEMIDRATFFEFYPNTKLITCSAEDLIVLKAFADRAKDWIDVESVVKRNLSTLETAYILKQLTPLAAVKEGSHILEKIMQLLREK